MQNMLERLLQKIKKVEEKRPQLIQNYLSVLEKEEKDELKIHLEW